MKQSADVVIIGGGITGTSIAFRLAKRGVTNVVLLEASQLAAGGTGKSSGVLRQFYLLPSVVSMAREGIIWYRDFGDMVEEGDASFVNSGIVVGGTAAHRERFLRGIALQHEIGANSRLLEREELSSMLPHLAVEDLDCALYESEAGYADPGGACIALAGAARRAGVSIVQGVPATGLLVDAKGVAGVVTPDGSIATRTVVNAAGLWADRVAQFAHVKLPIEISRHQLITVQRPPQIGADHPVFSDAVNLVYMRPESTTQFLIGSTDPADSRDLVDPDHCPNDAEFSKIVELLERSSRRVPCLADAGLVANWSGAYDSTPDGFPILGKAPEVPGLYLATGLSGHGFKLAPAISRMMVGLIVDGLADPVLDLLRLSRFSEGAMIDSPTTTTLTAMHSSIDGTVGS